MEQKELMPTGLSSPQFKLLTELAERATSLDVKTLQQKVQAHLEATHRVHQRNRLVNVRLATAICETIESIFGTWNTISEGHQNWLRGAILYFADCDDDEPDFSSALGFEDDAELLNACLKHANLSDLCIAIEDYDEA
ncbi:hypothetical protein N9Z53_04510 [Mariniblastus sp.]|nr:hypothetical protein [Mariniblastus sp.]